MRANEARATKIAILNAVEDGTVTPADFVEPRDPLYATPEAAFASWLMTWGIVVEQLDGPDGVPTIRDVDAEAE
jgi:hypothetical protein